MVNNNLLKTVSFSYFPTWSVESSIFTTVQSKYPMIPLENVLTRIKEVVVVKDSTSYKRITVKLYGKGVVLRDETQGKYIGTKRQFLAHEGQLILSRIDARNGAFGIVPKELEGAIVTNDFWLFDIHDANPTFLMLILASEQFQNYWQLQSSGTTNRQRICEQEFLSARIPIPPVDEQNILIQQYLSKIEEAKKCFELATEEESELEKYVFSALGIKEKAYAENASIFQAVNFSSLYFWGCDKLTAQLPYLFEKYNAYSFNNKPQWVNEIFRGKSPKYADSKRMILNQKCNRKNSIDVKFAKSISEKWFDSISEIYLTSTDDILINSTGEGTIGRASLVTKEFAGYLYDSHMLLLRVNKQLIEPELIVYLINSQFGQKQIEMHKSAQATKQTELGVENLKKIVFPLPDISIQRELVAYIKNITSLVASSYTKASTLNDYAKRELEEAVFGEA